jgi:hypothetical protein
VLNISSNITAIKTFLKITDLYDGDLVFFFLEQADGDLVAIKDKKSE